MKITFLGTSHGITEANRFTSAILLEVGTKYYLIDAGAPIMKLMRAAGVDLHALGGIFITHSHSDHYLGLVEFTNQLELFREFAGVKVTVYAPPKFPFYEMREFLFGKESREVTDFSVHRGGSRREDGGEGNRVLCEFYPDGAFFDDGNIRVSSIPTRHFPGSHAFLVEAEGKRLLFTGDLTVDLADMPSTAFDTPTDLIVTEAAHPILDKESTVATFRRLQARRVAITHICDWRNTPEMIATLSAAVSDLYPLAPVCDGDVIEL